MADHEFNAQELFAIKSVHVKIPSFLKGKTAAEVVGDWRIVSKQL